MAVVHNSGPDTRPRKWTINIIATLRNWCYLLGPRRWYSLMQLHMRQNKTTNCHREGRTLFTNYHVLHMLYYMNIYMLYYMNWLTHDFWTRTGGWEFDRSHGADTSSPSHWQQVEKQAPKPVGWITCFLLLTFVPVKKLCLNKYIYVHMLLYMSSAFFGLPIVSW